VSIIKRDLAVYGFDGAANFAAATYANTSIGGLQRAAYDNIVVDSNAAVNGLGAVDFGPVIDLYAAIHFAYLSKLFGMTIVSEQIAREQKCEQ